VGTLTLVDSDVVSESNVNRQIIALNSTVGMYKTEAMANRIYDINPEAKVITKNIFLNKDNIDDFDFSHFSYVADAIDTVSSKILIAEKAFECGTPLIMSMGAGNKLHPEMFEIADVSKTSVCPLARVMRTELKKRGITGIKCVYSKEAPVKVSEGRVPASISFVPSAAGLIIAGEIIRNLCNL
jgi:tRNA A37 threonylcarbamoyladenosine dehydratase